MSLQKCLRVLSVVAVVLAIMASAVTQAASKPKWLFSGGKANRTGDRIEVVVYITNLSLKRALRIAFVGAGGGFGDVVRSAAVNGVYADKNVILDKGESKLVKLRFSGVVETFDAIRMIGTAKAYLDVFTASAALEFLYDGTYCAETSDLIKVTKPTFKIEWPLD